MVQRLALAAYLRGEAPERSPKPGTFVLRCGLTVMGVSVSFFLSSVVSASGDDRVIDTSSESFAVLLVLPLDGSGKPTRPA